MNTASTAAAVAGWHPDPTNTPGTLRWWDGTRWTEHTRPMPVQHQAPVAAPRPAVPAPYVPKPPTVHTPVPELTSSRTQRSMLGENTTSFVAIAVVIGYLLLAASTGIMLLGVIPVMLSVNAISKGEKLAPLALLASVMSVAFALGLFE